MHWIVPSRPRAWTSPKNRSKTSSIFCRRNTRFLSNWMIRRWTMRGSTRDEPVTINLQNVTLRSALRLMLKRMQLTYIIKDEVLMITTPEEAESELIAKVYPVADLVIPIEVPQTGGGGGGIGGGQGGGGQGGGGGGFGGGGGGFGGGGGGGQGGGGGGFFSVPDTNPSAVADLTLSKATAKANSKKSSATASIKIDQSQSPAVFWDQCFAKPCDQSAVRQTARELMKDKNLDQLIAMIEAALRHGQPQSWMYESLGIAMELDGRLEGGNRAGRDVRHRFRHDAGRADVHRQLLVAARTGSPGRPGLPASREDRSNAARGLRRRECVRLSARTT